MSRRCTICDGLQEHTIVIGARIRAGESLAGLAQEFGVSSDAMERHAKNHVRSEQKPRGGDLEARLELLWARLDEAYLSATKIGEHKAAIEALKQLTGIAEQLAALKKKETSVFENLSLEDKVQYIRNDPGLFVAWCDFCIRTAGLPEN